MALTPTEEAQARQLIAQQAALLSLAGNEATITSKLGAAKVNLGQLPAASALADADLLLVRQGTTDKSVASSVAKTYIGTGKANSGANSDITSMTALTAINRTGGTAIKGTNTNDSAAAGYVGEYVSSVVPLASALSISNGPKLNITNISLTAGDWDISGIVQFQPAASTSVEALAGSISTTSETFNPDVEFIHRTATFVPVQNMGYSLPPTRMSFAVTTTVYLVAVANFAVSTMTAYGRIDARRVR